MTVSEKVAYIKGLMAGMKISTEDGEGKILAEIVDLLGDLADDIAETHEQLDAVDEDLSTLEEFVYEELDDDFDIDDEYCPGDCTNCDGCDGLEDDDDDYDYDTAEYSVACPACGEEFFIDESAIEANEVFECPACHEKIEFYVEDEEDESDN